MEMLNKFYSWILTHKIYTIVALALIVGISYFFLKKSKTRYYKLATKYHKKGEKFYNLGDSELAGEYYKSAEDCRKKAGEMDVV